ncbi:MAG TPA: PDZ domain-containing protein [Sphingobacteriaceae bacterium]
MKKFYFFAAVFFSLGIAAAQTNALQYEVSFPNAVHHEAEVSLTIPQIGSGPLKVRVSRSSPGRYATHEFGKNVYDVKATDASGKSITINQISGDVYEIPEPGKQVKVTYTVFGNHVDGTYLGIDETHAHMNIPATFMWVPSMTDRPVEVRFNDLEKYGWKAATQLKPGKQANMYTAGDFQYFMDSPVELSAHKLAIWKDINPDGTKQEIKLASHTADDKAVVDNYAKMVERMTAEAKAVFGELPRFDHGSYVFLQDLHPDNSGDGMEHRNSTVITSSAPKIEGNENRLLGTFSHEFFHAWNVERIRPKSLQPFNFEHANMSSDLWFAEGFTQYYGELILKRANFRTLDAYANTLGGLLNVVLNAPGAQMFSAPHMSRRAVFADAGVSVDQNNYSNTFTSYYYYGAVIALGLDLQLRKEFNLTLDDYMQAVWKAHGVKEIPYTNQDLQNVLAGLTNNAFAANFFRRYVNGTEKSDYEKLLAPAGLVLRKAAAGKATLGLLRLAPNKNEVVSGTLKGTPAYEAGIEIGDVLHKIGDAVITSSTDVEAALERRKPGDMVTVTFEHKGTVKTATVKLQENNRLEVVTVEKAGGTLTPEMEKFRNNWLSSKIK